MTKRRLGRGLGALLGAGSGEAEPGERVAELSVDEVRPNPWQPRREISDEALEGLVESIRTNGVLQPIVVRKLSTGYELIAGERRWRAARRAGFAQVPAIVRNVSDEKMLEFALVENIQRQDLDAIEKARAYLRLIKDLGWTQEQAASHVGEARATVANTIRLLELPEELQDLVSRGTITAGHGRALLRLRTLEAMTRLAKRIVAEGLSVRQVEEIVSNTPQIARTPSRGRKTPPHIREIEERLQRALATKVTVKERRKGGKIIVEFFNNDDFERIIGVIESGSSPSSAGDGFHV